MKTMWLILSKTEGADAILERLAMQVPCFVTWHEVDEIEITCRVEDAAFIEREIAHLI